MRRMLTCAGMAVILVAATACGSASDSSSTTSAETHIGSNVPQSSASTTPSTPVSWSWDESSSSYQSNGGPPECPSPLIDAGSLVDLSSAESKLLPGQERGGEYLVNGTIRWSGPDQDFANVTVRMPFDGYVTAAWQFLKSGTYLFGLNIVHPCGLMLRLSKMHDPSPEVKAAILDPLGEADENDSRETMLSPGVWLTKGTVLATAVGLPPPNVQPDVIGAQLDIAVLDLRERNPQIADDFDFTRWSGSAAPQYVWYARCAFLGDYLATSDLELVNALPLGGGSTTSDTCTTQQTDLPSLHTFVEQPSDQFLVDFDVVKNGSPFLGKNSAQPHSGAHILFGDDYLSWPRGGTAPSNYPPIYAVADGVVSRVDTRLNVGSNDRYGITLRIARDASTNWDFEYSIEPMVPEPSSGFYREFLLVHEGEWVTKGQIIAYMYTPANANGTHIHFELINGDTGVFTSLSIFTSEVTNSFHDLWGNFGLDGANGTGNPIPVCMGWKLAADENPFGTGSVDCL